MRAIIKGGGQEPPPRVQFVCMRLRLPDFGDKNMQAVAEIATGLIDLRRRKSFLLILPTHCCLEDA